jgi:multidrug efflux pump subunit AcrB
MHSQQRAFLLASAILLLVVDLCRSGDARPAPAPGRAAPTVVVEATYAGANASTVASTVAAPIEQQVDGVEGMRRMLSHSRSDGSYTLAVTFAPGTDLNLAQVLVQNRIALAMPVLPEMVKRQGLTVRKKSPNALLLVTLSSPSGRFDTLYLSNYATIQIKDELARLRGVGDVLLLGPRDYSLRVWLDPQKLAARNLTPADVVRALQAQNIPVPADKDDKKPKAKKADLDFTVKTPGRLTDPEQLADLVVKSEEGRIVRLKDVANVELGAGPESHARLNGRPVVVLAVYPLGPNRPQKLSTDVRERLAQLRKRLPDGLRLDLAFDFTANAEAPGRATSPEYLMVDVDLPDSASIARTLSVLEHCEKLLRDEPGVKDTLAVCGPPLAASSNRGQILVRLAPAAKRELRRENLMKVLRTRLHKEIEEALVRIRDLSGPEGFPGNYPIRLAIQDRGDRGKLLDVAERLAERLGKTAKLTDVAASPDARMVPWLTLDVDRTKARELGVPARDVFDTLQTYLGGYYLNDFSRFGRTWQVVVQAPGEFRKNADDLLRLMVRTKGGKMVPLGTFVRARNVVGPAVEVRLDGRPMVEITANPAPGVSLAQARKLCEELANQELPAGYRLIWLGEGAR